MSPAPVTRHQVITGRIHARLLTHAEGEQLGLVLVSPLDVVLSDTDVVQPDVLFVSQARLPEVVRAKGVFGAPDLVVEVISPSTEERDRQGKLRAYGRAGVAEHWLVGAGDQPFVEVRRRRRGRLVRVETLERDGVLTTPLLPGLSLRVVDIIPPPGFLQG